MTKQDLEFRLNALNEFVAKINGNKIQYFNEETGVLEQEMQLEEFQLQAIQESKAHLESELAKLS